MQFLMRKLLTSISVIASLFLAACSSDPVVNRLPFVYRIDVQQGNVVNQEMVNQLRVGMNKRQVQFILGAPMLIDPFHADRWDYVYLYNPGSDGNGPASQQRVTLEFEDRQSDQHHRHPASGSATGHAFHQPPGNRGGTTAGTRQRRHTHQALALDGLRQRQLIQPAGVSSSEPTPFFHPLACSRTLFAHLLWIRNQRPVDFNPVTGRKI